MTGCGVPLSRPGGPGEFSWPDELQEELPSAAGNVRESLALAGRLGELAPLPAAGRTAARWELLAGLAAVDVATARIVEPHLDALAILAEARPAALGEIGVSERSRWGVFAAHSSGTHLAASRDGEQWTLDGTKPWCSLASELSHAVVTAHTGPASRRAFAVALGHPGVQVLDTPWVARGLSEVNSPGVRFRGVPAIPVGPDEWYLRRPGFWWGGIGVAACWYGGALGLVRALADELGGREEVPPDGAASLGDVDVELHAARAALAEAAALADSDSLPAAEIPVFARRVRAVVAGAAERTAQRTAQALGPAALCHDAGFAKRHADLTVYLRQHHPGRERLGIGLARLGRDRAE